MPAIASYSLLPHYWRFVKGGMEERKDRIQTRILPSLSGTVTRFAHTNKNKSQKENSQTGDCTLLYFGWKK